MNVWTIEQAWEWYAKTPWQVGFNYVPSTAVNSTEMWQRETFDEKTIRRELAWAKDCGYNSVRVFLPFIVWEHEGDTFLQTFEAFLSIAAENSLSVLPILFDDCAFDGGQDPTYGKQPDPAPGVHNSRWTPSPGFAIADDPARQTVLRAYVHAIIGAHANDRRILAWDLYNEPGNTKRANSSLPLLVNTFRWARECEPTQPLTAGPWRTGLYDSTFHAMMELSDVLSFHSYDTLEKTVSMWIEPMEKYQKPMFVTEWLCRERENTFSSHLPLWAERKICCWQWGLVRGRTQTNLWWGQNKCDPWQHDTLHPDGTPYRPGEFELMRKLLAKHS
jgi:hypothetical protein